MFVFLPNGPKVPGFHSENTGLGPPHGPIVPGFHSEDTGPGLPHGPIVSSFHSEDPGSGSPHGPIVQLVSTSGFDRENTGSYPGRILFVFQTQTKEGFLSTSASSDREVGFN